jgi:YVTN family beta-propeller protein
MDRRVAAVPLLAACLAPPPSAFAAPPAWRTRLHLRQTIGGRISPKSVVASGRGLVFAQNMIYTHTITVYDRRGRLVKTIPDAVRLRRFGYPGSGWVHGGPVEAAFSPDGRYAYVSNYSMSGPGYSHPGHDVCSPGTGIDRSFVYRIDVRRLAIDRVFRVGSVPKFLAATPDGRFLLVSNWCSYTLSVVSTRLRREVRQVPLGAYPRGIAIDARRHVAYVAVMGSTDIARVDLRRFGVRWFRGVGSAPRHLVLDPGGRFLYATLNGEARVVKLALPSGREVASVSTGSQPRSMTISPDGSALYVVNYASNTVSKVRASDLRVLQTVPTGEHPIGITYDGPARTVWVACYTGSIMVFRDR